MAGIGSRRGWIGTWSAWGSPASASALVEAIGSDTAHALRSALGLAEGKRETRSLLVMLASVVGKCTSASSMS